MHINKLGVLVAIASALMPLGSLAAVAPHYAVTVYQPAPSDGKPLDINRSGHIAGMFLKPGGPWADDGIPAAFLSTPTTFTDISAVMPAFTVAGLNDAGDVAGYGTLSGSYQQRALLYSKGAVRNLGTLGGTMSTARAINNAGQLVGYSSVNESDYHAFVYHNGAMQDLGTLGGAGSSSAAADINNAGQVVGEYIDERYHTRAFLYQNGVMADIGTLGGEVASATDISDAGHLLGMSRSAAGIDHNFLYYKGTLRALPFDALRIQGTGVNSSGDVVGSIPSGSRPSGAYLWSGGEVIDLGTRVDSGWTLAAATAINDGGQIAALACTSINSCLPAVLTPVPEPGAPWMLMSGLGVLGLFEALARRRRRWGAMPRPLRKLLAGLMILLATSGLVAARAAAPGPYTSTMLVPPSGWAPAVNALNNVGQYAGAAVWANGETRALRMSASGMEDLGTLGGSRSVAAAINDRGDVVGISERGITGSRAAFLYRDGRMHSVGTLGGYSEATAVNNAGAVVGNSALAGGELVGFLYREGRIGALPPSGPFRASTANDINERGQIVGELYHLSHAYLNTGGTTTDLGTLGGEVSTGLAVNDAGQVVGWSDTADGKRLAYLYKDGVMQALPGDEVYSIAFDINNAGDIVGTGYSMPLLWRDGLAYDLNSLVTLEPGYRLGGATRINQRGQILAQGCKGEFCAPFVLTPVPEPATAFLLVAGLGMVAAALKMRSPRYRLWRRHSGLSSSSQARLENPIVSAPSNCQPLKAVNRNTAESHGR